MKIGIAIEDTWDFFHEIYAEFQAHHDVTLFERRSTRSPVFYTRINRYLFNQDMGQLLRSNDLVFFEWSSHLLAAASHMPKTCKIVTRLHRFELNEWADKVNWDNVDLMIVVCEQKKREVLARFPQLTEKIEVVYGAVDPKKFTPVDKPYAGDIGILCHLTPRKRVYDLILAFYNLLKVDPNFKLHIGGGMHVAYRDYHEAMVDTVERLGLSDDVIFYGHVDNAEEWLNNMDVIISNGYSEGLQVSALEAMSSGRHVLSHFWPGAEEMLPLSHLYFTDDQLIEKLVEYAQTTADQKKEKSAEMRQTVVEKFNIDVARKDIRKLVESIGAGTYRA